jgi:peptide/nickel transport system ATP-binding protein
MKLVAPIVDVQRLTVDFGTGAKAVRAVAGVDLTLARGETVALLGESGSGKSVTLRALMRLHPKSARIDGSIVVDGHDVLEMPARALARYRGGVVSMVFQDPGLAFDPVYRIGRPDRRSRRPAHGNLAARRTRACARIVRTRAHSLARAQARQLSA